MVDDAVIRAELLVQVLFAQLVQAGRPFPVALRRRFAAIRRVRQVPHVAPDPLRAGLELLPLLEAPVDFLAGADGDVVAVVRLADSDVDLPAMACPADMLGQRNNRRAQFAKGPFLPVGELSGSTSQRSGTFFWNALSRNPMNTLEKMVLASRTSASFSGPVSAVGVPSMMPMCHLVVLGRWGRPWHRIDAGRGGGIAAGIERSHRPETLLVRALQPLSRMSQSARRTR
ncbi:hypothetical protein [Pseudoxanthomonas suwonensis]